MGRYRDKQKTSVTEEPGSEYLIYVISLLPCYQLLPATNYRHQKIKRSYFSYGYIF